MIYKQNELNIKFHKAEICKISSFYFRLPNAADDSLRFEIEFKLNLHFSSLFQQKFSKLSPRPHPSIASIECLSQPRKIQFQSHLRDS